MWCTCVHVVHVYVYGASVHTCVFGDACMCIWCINMHLQLVMHVMHMCACGTCMCIYAHMCFVVHVVHVCVWYMYVYRVHLCTNVFVVVHVVHVCVYGAHICTFNW